MEHIDLRNLDKSNWKSYRFDQIAKNISERVDPNNTHLETYVGLEHIDSENIHITRTGTPDDVDGQKLRFYKGDIIFGRRRAYQRKAAIAECDGFCSAHALVLRANPEVIDPMLFPFFLHSDSFMHRAIDISVGSLSPTINWGTLNSQEFLLPPKPQQAKIAELLWAMDEVIEKEKGVLEKQEKLRLAYSKSVFENGKGTEKELSKVGRLIMGQSPSGETYNDLGVGMPFLQGNAEFGKINPKFAKYTTAPNKIVPMNSILISVRAPVGDLNIADIEYCIGRGLAGLYIDNEALRNYVYNFLKYAKFELDKKSTGSTFKAINKEVLASLKLIIPSDSVLRENSNRLDSIQITIENLELQITVSQTLQKSLINQIF